MLRAVFITASLSALCSLAACSDGASGPATADNAAAAPPPAAAAAAGLEAKQVFADYYNARLSTSGLATVQAKYKGKKLAFSGKVDSTDMVMGDMMVFVAPGLEQAPTSTSSCGFKGEENTKAKALKAGDTVSLECTIGERTFSDLPNMQDCIIR